MTDSQTAILVAVIAAAASLFVWAFGTVTAFRQSRLERQRDVFARAFASCAHYEEFPYIVRRRRADAHGEERVRISTELAQVQREMAYYSAWIRIESASVARAYDRLVAQIRLTIGPEIHKAWAEPGASSDGEMNISLGTLGDCTIVKSDYIVAVADHLSYIPVFLRVKWRGLLQSKH